MRKLKSLVTAILTAGIFPTLRVQGDLALPDSRSETPVPSDPKIKDHESRIAPGDTELTQARETITRLEKAAGETAARLNEMDGSLKKTVAGYKALLLQGNPEILPELVTGDSLEDLNSSLAAAKNLTHKIKENLKQQALNVRVPAGAPARVGEDTSGLSAAEKIRRGVERK